MNSRRSLKYRSFAKLPLSLETVHHIWAHKASNSQSVIMPASRFPLADSQLSTMRESCREIITENLWSYRTKTSITLVEIESNPFKDYFNIQKNLKNSISRHNKSLAARFSLLQSRPLGKQQREENCFSLFPSWKASRDDGLELLNLISCVSRGGGKRMKFPFSSSSAFASSLLCESRETKDGKSWKVEWATHLPPLPTSTPHAQGDCC